MKLIIFLMVVAVAQASREKRQTKEQQEMIAASECAMGCNSNFMQNLVSQIGLNPQQMSSGLLSRKLFEGENFEKFCTTYSTFLSCVKNCGAWEGQKQMTEALKPVGYVCVDRKDDFKKYLPCYQKAAKSLGDKCDKKCDTTNKMNSIMAKKAEMENAKNVDGMINSVGDLCKLLSCSVDCEIPTYKKECKDEAAGLLQSFVYKSTQNSKNALKMLKMEDRFPEQCTKLEEQTMGSVKTAVSLMAILLSVAFSMLM